jgi:exonuclease VII large subunit
MTPTPGAQFNSDFRSLVKSEIAKFAANVRPETAQAVASRPNKLAQLPQSGIKPAEEKLTHSQRELRAKDPLQIAQAEMPKLQKRAESEQVANGRQKQQQRKTADNVSRLPIEFGEFGGRVRSAATNNCRSEGLCRKNLPWFRYGQVDDHSL